jgi:hypothetical protein
MKSRTPRKKKSREARSAPPKVVRVPKTPAAAYDDRRPPSALLLKQLEHLQWAALPASKRAPGTLPEQHATTESEAAEKIGALTKQILAARTKQAPPTRTRSIPKARMKRGKRR